MIWTINLGSKVWHPRAGIVILAGLIGVAIPGLIVHLLWSNWLATGLITTAWFLLLLDID